MEVVSAVIAAVAALIGGGLLWWRHTVGRELAVMAATPTTPAGEAGKLPAGSAVEVRGTLRVREPLTAEFSRKPAAYFKSEIEREETYWERDSQGKQERRTRTSTVYTNIKYGSCLIQDDSGRVGIDFDGAEVEAVEVIKNEPCAAPGSSAGSGVIGTVLSALSSVNSTYRRSERILEPDIPVYVLGEVHEGGLIGKPKGSQNAIFVISHKSKEERTKSLTSTTRWLLAIAIILLLVAAGCLAYSIKAGRTPKAADAAPIVLVG